MSDLPDRAYMTPLLNRIADVAGERAAIILGREKAGQRISIPNSMPANHWLAELIGHDAAKAMAEKFGSQKIDIPPALGGDKRRRAMTIAQMIDKGYSINEIVRATGVSRSTVKEHLKKRPRDDRQGSLF
ncbi:MULTISPECIES: winged helix-turn-helix domain-containing protein [Agrobacterium]|uniref:winged helix-turn-helix domain-containing protein n=1 Tax=Agrobacterium TaxID=357 RepID=UPI000459E481|nr:MULTISPECIES: winged helix-turn-helix domain-containing protein [Agrobacterium]MCJ2874809.1 winged helix-turn-helix transcriptional regulator [Agrobacterium pusense]CDN93442.1 Helix-turn-helix domain of resolvase [Agrobacterium tumefaciens]